METFVDRYGMPIAEGDKIRVHLPSHHCYARGYVAYLAWRPDVIGMAPCVVLCFSTKAGSPVMSPLACDVELIEKRS